jgi:hypothetical protein
MDLSISVSEKRRIGGSSDKRRFEVRLSGGPPQSKDCYIGLHHAQSPCKTNNLNARFDIYLPGDSGQELRCQHSLNSHLLVLLDDFSVLATCRAARTLVASVSHERACLNFFLPVLA